MQALSNNVTTMYPNNQVFTHIQTFLRSKGNRSKNTQREYESDLRQFFAWARGKQLEELTVEHLKFINADVVNYQLYLSQDYRNKKGDGYKNTSVNRKMAAILSLYQFLKRNDYDINVEAMKVDALPDDSQGYGFLTFDEAEQLAELALGERAMGKQKRALIMTATRTSLRKEALLSLKWTDIRQSEEDSNVYIIEVVDMKERNDKGKKIIKEISRKMYDILIDAKAEDEYVFVIDPKYVNTMMNRLVSKLGLDPRRNLKFHAIKKAGVGFVMDLTNNIKDASDQAGHSSVLVTSKTYLPRKKNLAGLAMDEDISEDVYRQLTHDECVRLLESVDNGLGHQLKRKAQAILNSR